MIMMVMIMQYAYIGCDENQAFLIRCNSVEEVEAPTGPGLAAAEIACVLPVILQGHDLLKNMDPVYKLIWQKCFDLGGAVHSVDVSRYLECTWLLSHAIPLLEGLQLHVSSFLLFTTRSIFFWSLCRWKNKLKVKINNLPVLGLSQVRQSAFGTSFEDKSVYLGIVRSFKPLLKTLSISQYSFIQLLFSWNHPENRDFIRSFDPSSWHSRRH